VATVLAVCLAPAPPAGAATPGLPFTEDFSDTDLQDESQTEAVWSTSLQALLLPQARRMFAPFGPGLREDFISSDSYNTGAMAVGDMDRDGDLDVIAVDVGGPPRLYLNEGGDPVAWSASTLQGASSSGDDAVVADMDLDGDLDVLVTGTTYAELFRNDGVGAPFDNPSIRSFIEATDPTSLAVGDVNGDGAPDFVVGRNGTNVVYLNQPSYYFVFFEATAPTDAHVTTCLELADIDGDGDLDLVEGNDGEPTYLYLNNGTADPFSGVSGEAVSTNTDATTDIVVFDQDGDAVLDIMEANYGAYDNIFLNRGHPNWQLRVLWPTSEPTLSIATGDLDGDGDMDIVTGDESLSAHMMLPRGLSSEALFHAYIGSGPSPHVLLADINGDDALDVIVGDNGPNRLYLNNRSPNPWAWLTNGDVEFSGDGTPTEIALGDINGDGLLDLVVGYGFDSNQLYLNSGIAAVPYPAVPQEITSDNHVTRAIALGDIDGDGDLDVVAGNGAGTNRLYLNAGGDPVVWSASDITADIGDTSDVALGDVDGDGDLDIVAADGGAPKRFYRNDGGTPITWTASNITSVVNPSYSVALGDIDGDGDLDLVEGNVFQASQVYLNNGTADPWNGVVGAPIGAGSPVTRAVALGDVDADGDLDIVEGNEVGTNRLFLNDGGTPIAWTIADITADVHSTRSIALEDVDRDGDLDVIAVSNFNIETNRVYINEGGDPIDWSGWDLTADTDDSVSVAVGDVDNDGDPDALVSNDGTPGLYYRNRALPLSWNRFAGSDVSADVRNSRDGTLGDVDGDGDLDLVVGNVIGTNRLYLNNGTGEPWDGVTPADITSDDHFTTGVALGDVDGDGDLDLVAGNAGQANRLYRNDGGDPLIWTGFDVTSDLDQTNAVGLVDLDRDGDLDIVTAEAGSANRWYRNDGGDPPVWTGFDLFADFDFGTSLAIGDVDRDGDPDVLVGTTDSPNRLYVNLGGSPPAFSRTDMTADLHATWSVVLGDADNDGDLDALAGNLGQVNRVYFNEGGTPIVWSADDIGTLADNTRSLAAADMDFDGDLDLIVGNEGQPDRLIFQDPSDTILDLTGDAHSTLGLVVGDVDGDGDPDVVAINSLAPDRLYRAQRYDTVRGRATSLTVNSGSDLITNALLDVTTSLPTGTRADVWLSNDGGLSWELVPDELPFLFHTLSSDLRWRVELSSASPAVTPVVNQLDISTTYNPPVLGDRVWEDLDGDGIQDPGEPGIVAALIYVLDYWTEEILDFTFTDANGNYALYGLTWGENYIIRFIPPPGYVISPPQQGTDDEQDSDPFPANGNLHIMPFRGFNYHTRWDAGMVPTAACMPPDEPVYIYTMTLTDDGNNYPVLHFMDPNQPDAITGYHVYRSSDPVPLPDTWPLVATDIIDMDEATPNKQWVDTSGDVSPTGSWYYQVTAYNHRCPAQDAEGPF
jgi:hypothetical protein